MKKGGIQGGETVGCIKIKNMLIFLGILATQREKPEMCEKTPWGTFQTMTDYGIKAECK